jgi:hypothetical protein
MAVRTLTAPNAKGRRVWAKGDLIAQRKTLVAAPVIAPPPAPVPEPCPAPVAPHVNMKTRRRK